MQFLRLAHALLLFAKHEAKLLYSLLILATTSPLYSSSLIIVPPPHIKAAGGAHLELCYGPLGSYEGGVIGYKTRVPRGNE